MSQKELVKQDKAHKEYILKQIEEFNNNGKKTVAYFCDTFYPIIDGVIKVLDSYATLLKDKYNVVVFAPKHKGVVAKQDYLVVGCNSLFFRFLGYDAPLPRGDSFLNKVLKLLKIDIIHAHSPFAMGALAARTAKKRNIPFVMTLHSQYKMDFYKHTKSKLITKILTDNIVRVYNKTSEMWTMSDYVKNILNEYGYKGETYIIPNATEFIPFDDIDKQKSYINDKYKLGKDQLVFLFVGRLVALKNIHMIVDALKKVNDAGIDFKMFFVGGGPAEENLKKQIKELKLEDKIILTGMIKDRTELAKIYARSDLFVFPSDYDTDGLVKIEASTFDTPSILLENSAPASAIVDNVNGFLSKKSAEDLANKIIEIAKDKDNLIKVGKKAYHDLYITWKDVAKKVSERYEYWIDKYKNN